MADSAFTDQDGGVSGIRPESVRDRSKRNTVTELDRKKMFWMAILKENVSAILNALLIVCVLSINSISTSRFDLVQPKY